MILSLGYIPPPNPIYARSGWSIPLEAMPIINTAQRNLEQQIRIMQHPNATIRSLTTYPYNCVGMIFAARRAWIDIDHIYSVLRHDGYHETTSQDAVVGDVVVYADDNEPTHVGVLVSVEALHPTSGIRNFLVLSKWGHLPEFVHTALDVPDEFGRIIGYYTERVAS